MLIFLFLTLYAQAAPLQTGVWQTAVMKRAQFNDSIDFVFNLSTSVPEVGGGGTIRRANGATFPALDGNGISYSLFDLKPCGINLPHVHPRATELLYVINGTGPLRTWFVEENTVGSLHSRDVLNNLQPGQVTFFPQGLIHFEQNMGCDDIFFISALNSEDPGVNTVTLRLFDVESDAALAQILGLTVAQVAAMRAGVPQGPTAGLPECLSRCNTNGSTSGSTSDSSNYTGNP